MRALALAGICGALGACTAHGPGPSLQGVEPATALEGAAVQLTLTGVDFRPQVVADFDRPNLSRVDDAFTVRIGGEAATGVAWVDARTLTAWLPATLGVGTWDVTVVDPRGAESSLPASFEVKARPPVRLCVETLPGGLGTPVGAAQLRLGSTLALYSVERLLDGGFVQDLGASWSVVGGIGEVSPTTGTATAFTATDAGTGHVVARTAPLPDAVSGDFTVTACESRADCVDACHSQATCVQGRCLPGPVDKDSDGDGALDQRCVGGTDCDDTNPLVGPGHYEGPPWGPACRDGLDNDCNGLTDLADPTCAPGSAPIPVIAVSPPYARPGTSLTGDGSGTVDREQASATLRYEWDWDGDGTFEALGVTSSHSFADAGVYAVSLRVWDSEGLSGVATTQVVVAASADTGVVTIADDESNAGATPSSPGGNGFSLREALAWADATAGQQLVVLPASITAAVRSPLRLASSTRTTVVGHGTIDCSALAAGTVCLEAAGGPHHLLHLTVEGALGTAVSLTGPGAQLSDSAVRASGTGVDASGADAVVGPAVEVSGNTTGVSLSGARVQLVDSVVRQQTGAGVVVRTGSSAALVIGTRVFDNGAQGFDVSGQAGQVRLWFNTIHNNGQGGVRVTPSVSGVDLRDNLVTGNGGWGLDATATSLGALDGNDFFGNVTGACRLCGSLGPGTLALDPGYVDAALRDLRPGVLSGVIDRGLDLGVDRNGVLPGRFLGLGFDPGAFEIR